MASRLGSNEKSFPKKGKPFFIFSSITEVEEAGEGELSLAALLLHLGLILL